VDGRAGRSADGSPDGNLDDHAPGWREVILVGLVVLGAVLVAAVVTSALPPNLQDVVFRTPLAIAVLLLGTVGLLVWITRRPTPRV
jgi:hypothetical protein